MAHAVDLTTQRWTPEYRLPSPRTSMLGRDAEQRAIVDRLLDQALSVLTITGPGGVGKTRLALQVANEVRRLAFPDGVVFVPLGDLRDTESVLQRIAQSLLIPAQDRAIELAQIVTAIGSRSMLLVLDNLEQLVDAAPLFAQLAEAGPELKLLNTSRVPLRIRGEIEFPLAPLDLPELDEHHAVDVERIGRSPAVELFIERATSVNPGFVLTSENAGAIAQLCARLDGLPLAIELAAARMKLLSPSALLARFDNRLRVLGGGARDLPERQQTLRQTIAWSYDLLDPDERAIFRALAIFPQSFDLPAAAAVTGLDVDDPLLLDWITSLVDHSLIRRIDARGGESRLLMLETIREFGREQLKAYGEEEQAGANHAAYFRDFVYQRSTSVVGYYDVVGSDQVEQELANIHQALAWYLDRDDADGVASIVAAMGRQWSARGYSIEGKRWIDRALGLIDRVEPATQSTILRSAAWFSASSGLLDEGLARAELGVALSRENGLISELADGLNTLGVVHIFRREPELATAAWDEGLELANQASLGTKAGILNNLGVVARINRDFDAAERYFNESLAAIPPERRQEKEGHAYVNLSEIAFERGDLPGARRLFNLGMVSFSEQRRLDELFMSIQGSAHLAFVEGYPRRAAMLWGWAEQLRERLGISSTAFEIDEEHLTDKPIRDALGDDLFREMVAKGAQLSVEEIIALAIEGPSPEGESGAGTPPVPAAARSAGLTGREIEVLKLVVAGKTNQEIADTLFISLRTAQTHVTNILRKVGVDSRAALAAYAVREGLA